MKSPIFNTTLELPDLQGPASFGYKRSYYYHPGIDLYCDAGQEIVAMEDGEVVNIEIFTGPDAEPSSPWWNKTWAVMVEGESGVLGYCEIKPMFYIVPGMKIKAGDMLGRVIPVLKKDKGNGTTMLHFEQYTPGTRSHATWHIGEEKPESLVNPTELLRKVCNK